MNTVIQTSITIGMVLDVEAYHRHYTDHEGSHGSRNRRIVVTALYRSIEIGNTVS
ncbi:hypothetical protein WBG78_16750 [Chryseolinea sp. T2]|uniref:hypothetical protein n=1 Tax=Chryseolinea sp. T2 TaxID=3129255 RepID=UPI003077633C